MCRNEEAIPVDHFICCYAADHDKRVPPFLQGALSPTSDIRYGQITRETLAPYWDEASFRYRFDAPLFFVSREKLVALDFYPTADGFLASPALVEILARLAPDAVRRIDVAMIDERGRSNSRHAMSFCQVIDRRAVCDVARMDIDGAYQPEIDGPNRIAQGPDGVSIVAALHVVLQPDLPDLVAPAEIPDILALSSSDVREACLEADIAGLRFVPVSEIMVVDFFPGGPGGFSKTRPQWRERRDLDVWPRPVVRANMFDPGASPAEARRKLEELLKEQAARYGL